MCLCSVNREDQSIVSELKRMFGKYFVTIPHLHHFACVIGFVPHIKETVESFENNIKYTWEPVESIQ